MSDDPRVYKNHGDLIPVCKLSNGLWRYRCVRERLSGALCGNIRDLPRHRVRNYTCCVECARLAIRKAGKSSRSFGFRYKSVRDKFTPDELKRYHEILGGRTGSEAERDAVEILEIERKNAGAHCASCAKKYGNKVA